MVAANIKVYLRLRPSGRPSKGVSAQPESGAFAVELDRGGDSQQVDHSKNQFRFRFDGILGMEASQETVFDLVAKPVLEDVLQGINGTIFAYGQTGSGKTFTITGGGERFADRGLIPRAITYLFQAFQRGGGSGTVFKLQVSYLEIYNNEGYDLLSRDESTQQLEDLPRVVLRDIGDGNIHLLNLSVHPVHTQEDALNLLVVGDTNRVVAETPMNDASTRSHCIFILMVESTQPGTDTVRRAKLHLVDLAGSERISQTGVTGKLRQEATSINVSLFYLAQVIERLHERSHGTASHVPYRNSMMTSVLRDSLGGNCKTVMVATAAVEDSNLPETISTCRFAQRVSTIKNSAVVNEEMDPSLLIKRLRREVAELRDELKLLQSGEDGGGESEMLGEADKQECRQLVSAYLEEPDPEAPFVCGSVSRWRECFSLLREVYWQRSGGGKGPAAAPTAATAASGRSANAASKLSQLQEEVRALVLQVSQKDQEIGMMVSTMKLRNRTAISGAAGRASPLQGSGDPSAMGTAAAGVPPLVQPVVGDAATLLDRNKAFEVLRKSVRRTETLEENREAVVKLVQEAQKVGEQANAARASRETVKARVEKARTERALEQGPHRAAAEAAGEAAPTDSPAIKGMLQEMEDHRRVYMQRTQRLREVKAAIEQFQRTGATNAERLQRDFEAWFATYAAQLPAGFEMMTPLAPMGSGPMGAAPMGAAPMSTTPRGPHRSSSMPPAGRTTPPPPLQEPSPSTSSRSFLEPASALPRASSHDAHGLPAIGRAAPSLGAPPSLGGPPSLGSSGPPRGLGGAPPRPPSRGSAAPRPAGGEQEPDTEIANMLSAMAALGRS